MKLQKYFKFIILPIFIVFIVLFSYNYFLSLLNNKQDLINFWLNNIDSIYLSGKRITILEKSDFWKYFSDKEWVSIRFDIWKNIIKNQNILKFKWDLNPWLANLAFNICDFKKCNHKQYNLFFLKSDLKYTYFLLKEVSEINKEVLDKKNIYSFWNIYFFSSDWSEISLFDFWWFEIYRNDFFISYTWLENYIYNFIKNFKLINLFYYLLFIFLFSLSYKFRDFIIWNFKKSYFLWVLGIFFISLLHLYKSWNFIMYDEYYSWVTITQSFKDIILSTAGDVHPPGYYFLLKTISLIFWDDIIILKIINILLIFPLFYFLYKLYKLIFENNYKQVLLLTLLLISLNTYFFMFSSIIRMYLFWTLLFVSSSYFLLSYLKFNKTKDLFFYIIIAILSLYTHNYLIFLIFSQFCFALYFLFKNGRLKENIKKIIFSYFIIWLFYLPWLFVLLKQTTNVSNKYWIDKLDISNISQFFINYIFYLNNDISWPSLIFKNYLIISFVIILLLVLILFNYINKNKTNIFSKYLIFSFLITLFIVIFYSIFKTPIFNERYFLFILPFFITFFVFFDYKKLFILFFISFIVFSQNIWIRYLDNNFYYKDIDKYFMKIITTETPDIIINNDMATLVVFDYLITKKWLNIKNSIFVQKDITQSEFAYNWWSLFYKYQNIDKNNINNIKEKKIILFNSWEHQKNIIIPNNWKKLWENKVKIPYTIYENLLTK